MFGIKYTRKKLINAVRDSLHESEHKAIDHVDNAEHHQALAKMYKLRAERLRKTLTELEESFADTQPIRPSRTFSLFAPTTAK